jgi:hypothetical protein
MAPIPFRLQRHYHPPYFAGLYLFELDVVGIAGDLADRWRKANGRELRDVRCVESHRDRGHGLRRDVFDGDHHSVDHLVAEARRVGDLYGKRIAGLPSGLEAFAEYAQ